MEKAQS